MEIREVAYGGSDYEAAVKLRNALLRQPLGLDLWQTDLAAEAGYRHFILEEWTEVVACLVVVPHGPGLLQIRQMAVRPESQKQGYGRQLMTFVEGLLRNEGRTKRIFLNARVTAVSFYRKLGYQSVGEVFTEMGIPHQRMEKALAFERPKSKV